MPDAKVRVWTARLQEKEPHGIQVVRYAAGKSHGFARLLKVRAIARSQKAPGEVRICTGPDDPAADVAILHACAGARLERIRSGGEGFEGLTPREAVRVPYLISYLRFVEALEEELIDRVYAGKTTLVAVSGVLAAEVRARYGADLPVLIAPNGVDRDIFNSRARTRQYNKLREGRGWASDEYVVGFVGGDWVRKDVPRLVRICARLDLGDVRRVKLAILGGGRPQALGTEGERGLRQGWLELLPPSVDGVPAFLSSIDIFVSLSRIESFGIPPLEAMATGVPTVFSASSGLAEFIRAGEAELLSPDISDSEIGGTIRRIATAREKQTEMAKAGELASGRLPWEVGAQVVTEAIRKRMTTTRARAKAVDSAG